MALVVVQVTNPPSHLQQLRIFVDGCRLLLLEILSEAQAEAADTGRVGYAGTKLREAGLGVVLMAAHHGGRLTCFPIIH